jgi:PIN domain nuclease of toxin-antitoxin system
LTPKSARKVRTVAEATATYSPQRLLLDTHVWLWWYAGDKQLGRETTGLIKRLSDVRVSAASVWEISIKRGLGKLVIPAGFEISREIERDGFLELGISIAHAEAVHALPARHRDPFDRMLVAQAQVEGLTIVTSDDAIALYDVSILDARR